MPKRELDYSVDSKIDVNALDIEWLEHADLERLYIEQVAKMRKRVIKASQKYKIANESVKSTRSKLIQKCQNNPEKYVGQSKATDKQAEAFYRTHPDYLIVKRKMIKAETKMMMAEDDHTTAVSMKDLMHFTRTKALEELVHLHGQSYFAGPEVPREINKEIRKKTYNAMKDKKRRMSKSRGMKRNST